MAEGNVLKGFIELAEKQYNLKVVDSQYVKVDEKYDIYNFMLEVILNPEMAARFYEKYHGRTSAMHVSWSYYQDKIRFHAEKGNNILLLLDTVKS
jgi:hypothetical protein